MPVPDDAGEGQSRLRNLWALCWTSWQGPRTLMTQSVLRVSWLCFYNTVGVALLVYLFAVDAQGLDLLRISAERGFSPRGLLWNLLFLLGALGLSLSLWYSSRLLLGRDFPGYPLHPDFASLGRRWAPRLLGTAVPVAIGMSFFRLHTEASLARNLLGGAFVLLGLALLVFYVIRRRLPGMDATWMLGGKRHVLPQADLRRIAWVIGLSFILLMGLVVSPVWLPQLLGAPTIMLLGIGGIALFGSMLLTYWFLAQDRPAGTTLAILLALLFGLANDNHAVRQADDRTPMQRLLPYQHYLAWRERHPRRGGSAAEPVVFVTASGGGIRAAYWTASALAKLEGVQGFSDNLFAISGVSGGSLGAATYVALKRHQLDGAEVGDLSTRVRGILDHDFLSPVVAGMLFPDMVQRFLPLPIAAADRQRFLELAWEDAMGDAAPLFAGRFADLYRSEQGAALPSLLLNATLAETGQRAIVSNLSLAAFSDTLDLLGEGFALHGIRLGAAAGMSARFTYVSPAGSVRRADGNVVRVVDGGYFENSGAAAVLDLLEMLRDHGGDYRPILVLIRNDPAGVDVCRRATEGPHGAAQTGFNAAISEVSAPFEALLNTRQARGRLAEVEAARAVEALGGVVVEIPLAAVTRTELRSADDTGSPQAVGQRMTDPPLGWSLSAQVRRDMDSVMDGELGGLDREFAVLAAALQGGPAERCEAR